MATEEREEETGSTGGGITGFLGKGIRMEGRLDFEHTIRLDGSFKGEIASKGGTLVVGDSAEVEALIRVETAVITGLVKGTVEAAGRVELQNPGRVVGEIRTPNLIIGHGAVFQGNCVMTKKGSSEVTQTIRYEAGKVG